MTDALRREIPEPSPGQQVAAARASRGQNQTALAKALTQHLGRRLSRSDVSDLEQGKRTFTVDLLKALSEIQGFPYTWYLDGPYNDGASNGRMRPSLKSQDARIIRFPVERTGERVS